MITDYQRGCCKDDKPEEITEIFFKTKDAALLVVGMPCHLDKVEQDGCSEGAENEGKNPYPVTIIAPI